MRTWNEHIAEGCRPLAEGELDRLEQMCWQVPSARYYDEQDNEHRMPEFAIEMATQMQRLIFAVRDLQKEKQ